MTAKRTADNQPRASTFREGGQGGGEPITCDRCGEWASHSYEGVEPLDLCTSCYHALGRWLSDG